MGLSKRGSMLLGLVAAAGCAAVAIELEPASAVCARFELPAIPLASLQNAHLPGSIADDRRILLGGIGSDLWRAPGDARDEFWMLTDRGPNGQVVVDSQKRRTFLVPQFTPHVLRVRAHADALSIVESIALVGASGRPVGGLPNLAGRDETPFDATGRVQLDFDASGLDTEGLVRTRAGEIWLADEYGPSLVRVSPAGRVLARYVPAGTPTEGADYEVVPVLPPIYARRRANRGFEGLALSPDERTLFLALQSPLCVPDESTAKQSRQTRLLLFDIASERPVAEYVYRFEVAGRLDPRAADKPDELKLSGLVALDAGRVLALERTDLVAKLFIADTTGATDILGGRWDDPATSPSLEALADPAAAGVVVLTKELAVDLAAIPGVPGKIEGVALLADGTLAIANDNDFDVGEIDPAGFNHGPGAPSVLLLLELARPLR